MTPWTITHQAPLSIGFPKPDYWSGLPLPSPGDLLHPGIEPRSPALQVDSLPTELQGKLLSNSTCLMPCTSSFFSSVICLMYKGFPMAWMVKNLPAVQETQFRFLRWEDPLEKGSGSPPQYSCLENSMDSGAWWAAVHGVARVRHRLATKPPPGQ